MAILGNGSTGWIVRNLGGELDQLSTGYTIFAWSRTPGSANTLASWGGISGVHSTLYATNTGYKFSDSDNNLNIFTASVTQSLGGWVPVLASVPSQVNATLYAAQSSNSAARNSNTPGLGGQSVFRNPSSRREGGITLTGTSAFTRAEIPDSPQANFTSIAPGSTLGQQTVSALYVAQDETLSNVLSSTESLAEVAIWLGALGTTEIGQLFAGACPLTVCSSDLLCYFPLRFDLQDYGPRGLSLTGAIPSFIDHPPVAEFSQLIPQDAFTPTITPQSAQITAGTHREAQLRAGGFVAFTAGKQGPNVAAPPQIGSVITRQEQPPYQAGSANKGVAPSNTTIYRPSGAGRFAQEQPWHPLPAVWASPQTKNIASGIGAVRTVQEQPPYYPALTVSAELPSNVVFQTALLLDLLTPGNLVGFPLGLSTFTVQETPWHPSGLQFKTGIPITLQPSGAVRTVQEQPYHPGPSLQTGPMGINVAPPIRQIALTRQEQPFHPGSVTQTSVQQGNVGVGTSTRVILRQEQPSHPLPTVYGRSGSTGVPPQITSLFTRQEPPWHPLPNASTGVRPANVAPVVWPIVITRQELPGGHPAPSSWSIAPGHNVGSGIGAVRTAQEQPWHPGSFTGRPTPVLVPPVGLIETRQEQPWHPAPWSLASKPTIISPIGMTIGRQEQPWHPVPWQLASKPTVIPPRGQVITRQEPPWHPAPSAWFVQFGLNARPSVRDIVETVQQQPWHPNGFTSSGVQGIPAWSPYPDRVAVGIDECGGCC